MKSQTERRFEPGEPWADRAVEQTRDDLAWAELLAHVASAASASKPTKKWLAAAASKVEAIGRARFEATLRGWIALAAELDDRRARESFVLMQGRNGALLRGVVWAVGSAADAPMLDALALGARTFAEKVRFRGQRSTRVANACLRALEQIGSDEAIERLVALGWQIEYPSTQKLIERLLGAAAKARGVPRDQLAEDLARGVQRRSADSDVLAGELAAAQSALASDAPSALAPLLSAWRSCRDPRLAAIIEGLSRAITPAERTEALRAKTHKATLAAWTALCARADERDVGVLLELFPLGTAYKAALAQLAALTARFSKPDPRLASAFTALLVRPRYGSAASRQLYKALFDALVEHDDPRTLQALTEQETTAKLLAAPESYKLREFFEAALPRLHNALQSKLAALPQKVPAELDAVMATLQAATAVADEAQSDELLEAIYRDPDDDELRRVYADVLAQRGDARGELIALQLAQAPLSRPQRARERALLRTYGRRWLGPLDAVLQKQGLVYRRGFVAEGRLRTNRDVAAVADEPSWATIEKLDAAGSGMAELFSRPVLSSLRALVDVSVYDIAAICSAPEPLRLEVLWLSCHWQGWWYAQIRDEVERTRDALTKTRALPALRDLHVHIAQPFSPQWLFQWPLARRVERLRVSTLEHQAHLFVEQALSCGRGLEIHPTQLMRRADIAIDVTPTDEGLSLRFWRPPVVSDGDGGDYGSVEGALARAAALMKRLHVSRALHSATLLVASQGELAATRHAAQPLAQALRGRCELAIQVGANS